MDKDRKNFLIFKESLGFDESKIKIFKKSLKITQWFIGKTCQIYNGKTFLEKKINKQMVGLRFGQLILTRGFFSFKKKQSAKRQSRKKK